MWDLLIRVEKNVYMEMTQDDAWMPNPTECCLWEMVGLTPKDKHALYGR